MYVKMPKQISLDICDKILDIGKMKKLEKALVGGDTPEESVLIEKTRDSKIAWITEPWILAVMYFHANLVNREGQWNYRLDSTPENAQFTTYTDGGHYDFHVDTLDPKHPRKISVILMLSEKGVDYKGGDFEIKDDGLVELSKGDMLVFPSDLLHRVNPVTEGKRTSLITWVRGPEWR